MASEDEELSRDVNTLGRLLGEVLREQEGEAGFALVEELRARTKALRAQDPDPPAFGPDGDALLARCAELGASDVRLLVRAFTLYFHLVNVAEEHHRLRVLRQRDSTATGTPRPESVAAAIQEAAAAGRAGGRGAPAGRRTARRARLHRPSHRVAAPHGPAQAARAGGPRRAARRPAPDARGDGRAARPGARGGDGAVADRRAARPPADGAGRGPQRALLLRGVALDGGARASIATWRRRSPRPTRARRWSCRRSCGSAPGSAATATAIRTSPRP